MLGVAGTPCGRVRDLVVEKCLAEVHALQVLSTIAARPREHPRVDLAAVDLAATRLDVDGAEQAVAERSAVALAACRGAQAREQEGALAVEAEAVALAGTRGDRLEAGGKVVGCAVAAVAAHDLEPGHRQGHGSGQRPVAVGDVAGFDRLALRLVLGPAAFVLGPPFGPFGRDGLGTQIGIVRVAVGRVPAAAAILMAHLDVVIGEALATALKVGLGWRQEVLQVDD